MEHIGIAENERIRRQDRPSYQKKFSLISDENKMLHIFHFLGCIKLTISQKLKIGEFFLVFFPFLSAPSASSIMSEWFCIIYKK